MTAPNISIEGVEIDALLSERGIESVYSGSRHGAPCRIHLRVTREPVDRDRFVEQGRAVAGIRHPNVLALLGCGATDACVYKIEEVPPAGANPFAPGERAPFERVAAVAGALCSIAPRITEPVSWLRPFELERIYVREDGVKVALFDLAAAAEPDAVRRRPLLATIATILYRLLSGEEPGSPPRPLDPQTAPLAVATAIDAALRGDPLGRPSFESLVATFAAARHHAGPVCAVCGRPIPPEKLESAAHRKGRYVCAACRGPRAQIPGFVLGDCLHEGREGTFFAARSDAGERRIVVVLPIPGPPSSAFETNAAKATAIRGPGLVEILHAGRAGSSAIYSVIDADWTDDLERRIKRAGPLAIRAALEIGHEIARGLAALEEQHFVPGEVEPSLIKIAESGRAGLFFGVSRVASQSALLELRWAGAFPLSTGLCLPYAAPELIEDASSADARTAVYGLGACLYFALTGKKPFSAKTNMDYFMKVLNEDPPPISEHRSDVPPIVAHMIAKCMKKKRAERYAPDELAKWLAVILLPRTDEEDGF